MRIGTWNLAGRWDSRHELLINDQQCDVWLLTEVGERLQVDGFLSTVAHRWWRPSAVGPAS